MWGGSIGKQPTKLGQYASECYLYINPNTSQELTDKIIHILKTLDWKTIGTGISDTYVLSNWKIYKTLKDNIPELTYSADNSINDFSNMDSNWCDELFE